MNQIRLVGFKPRTPKLNADGTKTCKGECGGKFDPSFFKDGRAVCPDCFAKKQKEKRDRKNNADSMFI